MMVIGYFLNCSLSDVTLVFTLAEFALERQWLSGT